MFTLGQLRTFMGQTEVTLASVSEAFKRSLLGHLEAGHIILVINPWKLEVYIRTIKDI